MNQKSDMPNKTNRFPFDPFQDDLARHANDLIGLLHDASDSSQVPILLGIQTVLLVSHQRLLRKIARDLKIGVVVLAFFMGAVIYFK